VGLKGNRAFGFERFHHLRHAENRVQVVFFVVLRAFEATPDACQHGFHYVRAIAYQHSTNGGAQNAPTFNGRRVYERRKTPPTDNIAAKHANEQKDNPDDAKHSRS
jgi:hypothetical protein